MTSTTAISTISLPKRLLGVWAHPDDESYLSAGLMARVVEAGGTVTVVTVTDGELGFPDDDDRSLGARAAARRREMMAAMGVLGVHDVRFLGHADGGLTEATLPTLTRQVAAAVRALQPDAIVTFGPDGATGHPDHIMTSHATTAAWVETGRGQLLYSCQTVDWYDEFRPMHDAIGMWMGEEPAGTPADGVTVQLDLSPAELDRKRQALAGHESQTAAVAALMGEDTYRRWWERETFRRPDAVDLVGFVEPVLELAA